MEHKYGKENCYSITGGKEWFVVFKTLLTGILTLNSFEAPSIKQEVTNYMTKFDLTAN